MRQPKIVAVLAGAAQVAGLVCKAIVTDGRIFAVNHANTLKAWQAGGETGAAISLVGRGPGGV